MEAFDTLTGIAAPLLRDNVDTDTIIPSREIRSVSRKGLADGLFAGWRYDDIDARIPKSHFVLNKPAYAGTQILVSGSNFGCGSSREHAVWALLEFGIQAVIAPSFNPIFRNNCVANGVVPVALERAVVDQIATLLKNRVPPVLTVDLVAQQVRSPGGGCWHFEIDTQKRDALLAGLDPIRKTLERKGRIESFRLEDARQRPWVYDQNRITGS